MATHRTSRVSRQTKARWLHRPAPCQNQAIEIFGEHPLTLWCRSGLHGEEKFLKIPKIYRIKRVVSRSGIDSQLGCGILTALKRKCFYKDSQTQVIGSRMFALTRTCDIQRLRFPQLQYHIFKAHDGFTIQVMKDAARLSIFLCAFNCEIGTCRAIF
jgi:hypothetical protein